MQESKIISLANLTGKILLQSGAETSRVENCIQRVCRRFGLQAQCFVSITCIITSAKNREGDSLCSVERVTSISNNLNRIDQIHDIILHLEDYDENSLEKAIFKLRTAQIYSPLVMTISYFFAAFFFSLLFKGTFKDAFISGLGGILIFHLNSFAKRLRVNSFFLNTIGGFLATLFSFFWYKIFLFIHTFSRNNWNYYAFGARISSYQRNTRSCWRRFAIWSIQSSRSDPHWNSPCYRNRFHTFCAFAIGDDVVCFSKFFGLS